MNKKAALVFGASGLVGSYLLQRLLIDDRYGLVKAAVRRSLPLQHSKLEQIKVDFDKPDTLADLFAVDEVYICLGTTIKNAGSQAAFTKVDYTYPMQVAQLAKQHQVNCVAVVSALGADAASSNFYMATKGKLEMDLQELKIEKLILARPSMLLGPRQEFRLGESIGKVLMQALRFVFVGPFKKYKAIHASTVANALIVAVNGSQQGTHVLESDVLQVMGEKG